MLELLGLKNAWLSPDGQVISDWEGFDSSYGGWHETLGGFILKSLGLELPQYFDYNYEYLESLGYIRLCGWHDVVLKWVIPCEVVLTDAQKRVIWQWCEINDKQWHQVLDTCRCCLKPSIPV